MRKLTNIGIALAISCLVLGSLNALPTPKIVCFALPPFVVDNSGKPAGLVVDITQKILAKAGIAGEISLLPIPRALSELDNGDTIFIYLTRTPERDPKYNWITLMYSDSVSFASQAPAKPFNTLDEARASPEKILVTNGGAPKNILQKNNVTNVDFSAPSDPANIEKLLAGHGVAMFAATSQYLSYNVKAGKPVLNIGKSISPAPMWMCGSKNLDPALIKKIQDAAVALNAEEAIKKAFAAAK